MKHRKATIDDLTQIITLLANDELGQTREKESGVIAPSYIEAFKKIDADPNQYLMVVTLEDILVGTCHLTLMPSLTFSGSLRLNIEAVRVDEKHRGKKVGEWMLRRAIDYAKENDVKIIQLATNNARIDAKRFYEKLGFESTHQGMKLYL